MEGILPGEPYFHFISNHNRQRPITVRYQPSVLHLVNSNHLAHGAAHRPGPHRVEANGDRHDERRHEEVGAGERRDPIVGELLHEGRVVAHGVDHEAVGHQGEQHQGGGEGDKGHLADCIGDFPSVAAVDFCGIIRKQG